MRWLKSLPAFFTRCAEEVPCPCCEGQLRVVGSRNRSYITAAGVTVKLRIRRLRCKECGKIHHELPDCIVPYKRYASECIEEVLSETEAKPSVPADESTLYRWRCWYEAYRMYWYQCLMAIAARFRPHPVKTLSASSQTAHQVGRLARKRSGWLRQIVRPLVNAKLWLHTRIAFLS